MSNNDGGFLHQTLQLDDDSETFVMLMMLTAKAERRVRWNHERINWKQHVEKLRHTNGFQKRYHMSERSFNQLVDILCPQVSLDELQSYQNTGGNDPITPEMVVGAGLRFLGGEHVKSIADIFGMSESSVVRIVKSFLVAVDSKLEINIPSTCLDLKSLLRAGTPCQQQTVSSMVLLELSMVG